MLQVNNIRAHKDAYITALKKRNFDATSLFEDALKYDDMRKASQTDLDAVLAESNRLSKEIGMLFKSGEHQKANAVKAQTADLKENSKRLQDELRDAEEKLQNILFEIPNIPNDLVPAGVDEADNE